MKVKKLGVLIAIGILFLWSGCLEQSEEVITTSSSSSTTSSSTTTLTTISIPIITSSSSTTTSTTTSSTTTTTINPLLKEYVNKGYRELTLKVYIFCRTCKPIVNQRLRENEGVVKQFNEPDNVWRIIYAPNKTDVSYITHHIGGYDYEILEERSI